MAVPLVTNRVPDLNTHFVEGQHYYGFGDSGIGGETWTKYDIDEAEAKILMALSDYDKAQEMAWNAHKEVKEKHLYDHRIQQIFDDFNL